jgi:hypothetical protein
VVASDDHYPTLFDVQHNIRDWDGDRDKDGDMDRDRDWESDRDIDTDRDRKIDKDMDSAEISADRSDTLRNPLFRGV